VTVRILTWNLYFGAGLEPVFRIRRVDEIPPTVGTLWRAVLASEPAARMEKVADVLAAARPDLVALQEVALYEVVTPGERDAQVVDFLALLVDALRRRGEDYRPAVSGENFGAALPDDEGRLVSFVDRDVVLARAGVVTHEAHAVRFAARARFGPADGFEVPRGFVTVRAEVDGVALRLVDVHLEGGWFGGVQGAQADELLAAILDEPLPAVLAGDVNAGPFTPIHDGLLAAGFEDPWEALRGGEAGPTCCRGADLRSGGLSVRIDVVLQRGLVATDVARVGVEPGDRTPSGRWPSDHAGVVATLARAHPIKDRPRAWNGRLDRV
jgi:endonuclease/exonuclease/phosphatase family metal-dependent hydrolase